MKLKKAKEEAKYAREHSLQMLTSKEMDSIKTFRESHYKLHPSYSTFIYELTGTGIGTIIKIKCPICNEELDVTDIDSW